MDTWQPIDTAPMDGTWIDLWDGQARLPDCWWESGQWWLWDQAGSHGQVPVETTPTHWMAIPNGPTV